MTHCMFCDHELEPISPEGVLARARVAFDPWLGRLWQVCSACSRWNIVPLEDRWDALEQYDRVARDEAELVLQTEHLSLLATRRGQLIRVGEAPRVELADWRYSSRLDAYPVRRRSLAQWFVSLLPERQVGDTDPYTRVHRLPREWTASPFIEHGALLTAVFGAVPLVDACPSCGYPMMIEPSMFSELRLTRERAGLQLVGTCALCGDEGAVPLAAARPTLRMGLAVVTRSRRQSSLVVSAARRIERLAGADAFMDAIGRRDPTLGGLSPAQLVAVGMGLDEQTEAEALEAEWRVAEELAGIVDDELTEVPGFHAFRARVLGGVR
jgi:hypothetical protein